MWASVLACSRLAFVRGVTRAVNEQLLCLLKIASQPSPFFLNLDVFARRFCPHPVTFSPPPLPSPSHSQGVVPPNMYGMSPLALLQISFQDASFLRFWGHPGIVLN